MSLKIREVAMPRSQYAVKCPYEMTPTRIVIHNTAGKASAANEIAYMQSNANQVSFHFAVDEEEAVLGSPLNRNCWHSGDGATGKGNREGIAIEICRSATGGELFARAEENGAELAAILLHERGWGIDRVTKHQDYSGKYCPHRTLDLGWDRFLGMVQGKLDALETTSGAPVDGNVPHEWAKEAFDWSISAGILKGSSAEHPDYRLNDGVTREEMIVFLRRAVVWILGTLGLWKGGDQS